MMLTKEDNLRHDVKCFLYVRTDYERNIVLKPDIKRLIYKTCLFKLNI